MKNVMVILTLLFCVSLSAQNKKVRKSQAATVIQTIGTTQVQFDYSRPLTKGRSIFGKLVPYGNVWRTGANYCTTLTIDSDVTIEGKKLAKGKYSFYTIPDKSSWTVIINKKLSWGTQYDSEQDVLRFKVKPTKTDRLVEAFTIHFPKMEQYKSSVELAWENTRVSFDIQTK